MRGNIRKRGLAAVLVLLAGLAVTAASASAHGTVPITKSNALFTTYCGSGAGVFNAVARLTSRAGTSARGKIGRAHV